MLCHTTSDFPGKTITFSSGAFKPSSDRLGIVHPRAQAQHKAQCQQKSSVWSCNPTHCVVMQGSVWNTARVENQDISAALLLPGP